MNKKYTWVALFVVLIVGIVFWIGTSEEDQYPESRSIFFYSAELTDNSFVADAYYIESATSFRKYSYTIDEEGLHIVVKSGLVNKKYPYGQFDIAIYDDLSTVKHVYIKDGKPEFLVYER
jgi:hypothetical protein